MQERFTRLKDTLSHIGSRSISVMIAVFFIVIGITAIAGFHMYSTEKTVIVQQGEINARESAAEYNNILLTRVNIITLSGCAVDHMISSGIRSSDIEQYMTEQTQYIIETLDPSTTGLYGWINETYLDGSGWVPDADYVPTERPWYIQTLESSREITFVEPYLDMQTGTVMMTVSQLLNDGKSVIAMDVSLDPLQQIVRHVSSSTDGSQALILDVSGIVVAHSDERELGKNYLEEENSLSHSLAEKILREHRRQFDIETDEGNFSVYVDELFGGWYSVSLINSDIWYRPLRFTMIAVAVILSLVAAFLVVVFLRIMEQNLSLQRLHSRINMEEQRGDQLRILSETDRMTGLFDRISGKRKVNDLLSLETAGMFIELDVDSFKSINDTFGHQAGDKVILAVADAMRHTFRSNDITMRLGGDEFGVFAVGIVDQEMAEMIISRLFTKIETVDIPELSGKRFTISVGAAMCSGKDGLAFDDLYARADEAMYISKKTPGNSLTFSD